MFEIIRSEYGREIKAFEFDYLGNHKSLDSIILNAHVKIFKNGLYIGSWLSENYIYLKWNEILEICYIYGKKERIEIKYDKGTILLEKAKNEINMEECLMNRTNV